MNSQVRVRSRRRLWTGKILELVEEELDLPEGRTSLHVTALHPGAVVIAPEIRPSVFLLVRQYRHSVGRVLLEFPAGTLGVGEEPEACARREVREETGFAAADWTALGCVYPAPGFCSEKQWFFRARSLTFSPLEPDLDEILEPVELTLRDIESAIDQGEICDGKSLAMMTLLLRSGRTG